MADNTLCFIVNKQKMDNGFIKYGQILLNDKSVIPYKESMLTQKQIAGFPHFGSVCDMNFGELTERYPYVNHNYDLVVVLGKFGNTILVYGPKAGEQKISRDVLDNNVAYIERGDRLLVEICNKGKKSDLSPYMWMFIAPPVLNHIDNSNKENENNIGANNNSNPDLTIQGNDSSSEANKINLISSNDNFKEQREINDLLRIYNENIHDQLIFKVMAYHEKHKNYPYIEKENENIFNKIFLQNNICC